MSVDERAQVLVDAEPGARKLPEGRREDREGSARALLETRPRRVGIAEGSLEEQPLGSRDRLAAGAGRGVLTGIRD